MLAPSNGRSGTRLAVIELDDDRFLSIELLIADGFDDHLTDQGGGGRDEGGWVDSGRLALERVERHGRTLAADTLHHVGGQLVAQLARVPQ